eukprot:TRINITY_DN12662_c0_g1_i1.p1 TRINITY_DN12662_c0_g1~~TRINITY_DN12662_c0_g1_i1.p1  ORF type:complete len:251 (+),score=14.20 TRINITY_DN12662_c0_g1_i1:24-755(+)
MEDVRTRSRIRIVCCVSAVDTLAMVVVCASTASTRTFGLVLMIAALSAFRTSTLAYSSRSSPLRAVVLGAVIFGLTTNIVLGVLCFHAIFDKELRGFVSDVMLESLVLGCASFLLLVPAFACPSSPEAELNHYCQTRSEINARLARVSHFTLSALRNYPCSLVHCREPLCCCVCLEELKSTDVVIELFCHHTFHDACLYQLAHSAAPGKSFPCPMRCAQFTCRSQAETPASDNDDDDAVWVPL